MYIIIKLVILSYYVYILVYTLRWIFDEELTINFLFTYQNIYVVAHRQNLWFVDDKYINICIMYTMYTRYPFINEVHHIDAWSCLIHIEMMKNDYIKVNAILFGTIIYLYV